MARENSDQIMSQVSYLLTEADSYIQTYVIIICDDTSRNVDEKKALILHATDNIKYLCFKN